MIKAVEIIDVKPYEVICKFNNGELRQINMKKIIMESNDFVNKQKLLEPEFFKQATIGTFGQLYWADAAFFRNENGELVNCEFDLSPEFIFHNSKLV